MRTLREIVGHEEAQLIRRALFLVHLAALGWTSYAIGYESTWPAVGGLFGTVVSGAWLVFLFGQEFSRQLAAEQRAEAREAAELRTAAIGKATVPARVAQLTPTDPTTITRKGEPL